MSDIRDSGDPLTEAARGRLQVLPQHAVPKGPANTPLMCPACHLSTWNGKSIIQQGPVLEVFAGDVRKQDRKCLACGHQWSTVLPPRWMAVS